MQEGISKDWINMDFYKHLNYSIGNEDWNVEQQALQVKPGDRVICVTASGDRPLHLLMTDCAEIISIDMNRIQNHLLELKLAAIAALDYEKYLAFLGCTPCANRDAILQKLKPFLSAESAEFWEKHKKLLRRGIIYQGRIERLTKVVAKGFGLVRRAKIKKLFAFDDIESQRQFVTDEWDTPGLHKLFSVVVNPKMLQYVLNDPGLNTYVDFAKKPGVYIYQRMIDHLHNHLAKKSALLQLLFTGKVSPEAYFPYLTYDGYKAIRHNMNRVKIITGNTIEFLGNRSSANQIDCFSMSDIASYMPQTIFETLLASIKNAAKPNARFCLREFISNRQIPLAMQPVYKRDSLLEQKLENEESNFVYRFMVGEIQK
jgi:S-adenosylmethionine-diacylglycerol 3-amino-3-carboxypropyl transferase